MRLKLYALRWALGIIVILHLFTCSSGITVRKTKSKTTSIEREHSNNDEEETGRHRQLEDYRNEDDDSVVEPVRLLKKTQNLTEDRPVKTRKVSKHKEDSPLNVDVIRPTELAEEEVGDDNGEELAKADVNRDKNPRIYYDDAAPRYPSHHRRPHHHHHVEQSDFEGGILEGKEKEEEKYYYPKNYMSQFGHGHGHQQGGGYHHGLPGKRAPDHVRFDVTGNHPEYHIGHGPSHSTSGHHHVEEHGPVEHDTPYGHGHGHGIEETAKGKGHVAVYGGFNHGSYRHTLGDKVDVLGKALRVLVPSALLVTGVSALFPNRIHVPTTPNKYRQKRSAVFRRRMNRGGVLVPPPPPSPIAHMAPEFEDIPSHALHAEHRIMDGEPIDIYPAEYGTRYAASSHSHMSSGGGFDPFKVFKGPGPERVIQRLQDAVVLPQFSGLPEMASMSDKDQYVQTRYREGQVPWSEQESDYPSSTYGPGNVVPPTVNSFPENPTTQMNVGDSFSQNPAPQMNGGGNSFPQNPAPQMNIGDGSVQTRPVKRRKTTRKPPVYLREKNPEMSSQQLIETQKQHYLVKNTLGDVKQNNPVKAEEEFMSTLQNLVTPDVAKAIVENKQDPPKNVDLSPDGPVMGLLTSYAQHEKDSPNCQKRALCELAVKGKSPKASKFEAFLWSVATLVPDVFSEMYDLQEVFQSIRDEQCRRFSCPNPNLDLQLN